MGIRAAGLVLLCLTSNALAQPGPDQGAYPPPPQTYAPPPAAYNVPPPAQYAVQITEEERDLLLRGEIDNSQIVLGGLGAIFFGFGLGQAVEGRWSDTGWIFTFGEIGALSVLIAGAIDAANDPDAERDNGVAFMIGGALAFTVLRVWESVDAFTGPASHNRRVRALRTRLGYSPYPGYYGMTPYVTPTGDGGGAAGLSLRF